jgi:hypothetical protein
MIRICGEGEGNKDNLRDRAGVENMNANMNTTKRRRSSVIIACQALASQWSDTDSASGRVGERVVCTRALM